MKFTRGDDLIEELCKALGLEPSITRAIDIRIRAGEIVTAEIQQYLPKEYAANIAKVLRSRRVMLLERVEEPAPVDRDIKPENVPVVVQDLWPPKAVFDKMIREARATSPVQPDEFEAVPREDLDEHLKRTDRRIVEVISSPNGMVMVFDQHGHQMPEYQGRLEEVEAKIREVCLEKGWPVRWTPGVWR